MGIPLGHKLKIIKRIKELRTEKGMSLPSSRQGTTYKEAFVTMIPATAEKSGKSPNY